MSPESSSPPAGYWCTGAVMKPDGGPLLRGHNFINRQEIHLTQSVSNKTAGLAGLFSEEAEECSARADRNRCGAAMDQRAERLARGDPAAFAELYDACADRVHHYLVVRLGSRADADDVLQETFVCLARTRKRLATVENLEAYVFATARNEAIRLVERQAATAGCGQPCRENCSSTRHQAKTPRPSRRRNGSPPRWPG